MKLKAIYNAVILKPYEFEEELHGNIIVPDLGNEKNKIGKVVSVGEGITIPGVGFVKTTAKIGDIAVLPTMGFTRFEFKGEDYYIGPENQILAIIEEDFTEVPF
jgi:co-chaperonin GroES (HSP10)